MYSYSFNENYPESYGETNIFVSFNIFVYFWKYNIHFMLSNFFIILYCSHKNNIVSSIT